MVERFVKLSKCIKIALIQVRSSILTSDSELLILKNLVKVLKPVKLGAEALCRGDSNLLRVEKVFSFVLSQLQSYESDISKNLYEALKRRILSTSNPDLIHLIGYLNKPSFLLFSTIDAFSNSIY